MTVRAAIVGTGGIAHSHMRALGRLRDRVEVVALVDTDPSRLEAFGNEFGIGRRYPSIEQMLQAESPDLVHICTPPWTHTELVVRSLEAGAWVLCEKPLCGSLAEFDRISAAEESSGKYCSTVFQWRFGTAAQQVRRAIASCELGRPLVAVCNTTWYRDQGYYSVPWRGKWATELGGVTVGHGIHLMDLLLWLMGEWQEVTAVADTLDRQIEVDDVSMAIVRFEGGALGSIVNSVLSPRQESYLRLDLQGATLEVRALYGYSRDNWSFTPAPERDAPNPLDYPAEQDVPSSHEAQIAALLDSMERGERPLVSGREARRIIEFMSALYKSAATRQPVARGSIAEGDPFYHHLAGKVG